MLSLCCAPDNASLVLHLVLQEAGIPFETARVERGKGAQDGPEFRALNPGGKIPVLITPQAALSETAAFLL